MADWVGLSTEDDRISLRCTCDRPAGRLPSRWSDSRLPWRLVPPAERPFSFCAPPALRSHSGRRTQFATFVPLQLIQHDFVVQRSRSRATQSLHRLGKPFAMPMHQNTAQSCSAGQGS